VRDPESVGVVTQTTLSVDDTAEVLAALQRRFPTLLTPRKEDICYATQNRQDAVKKLVEDCDVVVVVGSQSSSNSNRLREIAAKAGKPGYLVTDRMTCDRSGSRTGGPSASQRAPRRRSCSCSASWRASGNGAGRAPMKSSDAPRTWCSRCRGNCARSRSVPAHRSGAAAAVGGALYAQRVDREGGAVVVGGLRARSRGRRAEADRVRASITISYRPFSVVLRRPRPSGGAVASARLTA